MRNPFASRRITTARRAGSAVPGPEVMAGMEYLDPPATSPARPPAPEVAVCGIDPQVPGRPAVPRVQLVVADGHERPDSVDELLLGGPRDLRVRRLTLDVRGLRDVLESRGGWNLLASLVRDPADRVTNAVFRAAIGESGAGSRVVEAGDVDADVCIVGEGDTVAGRCRHELGRARLSVTPFLAESGRLTRRLAEALARPRDRGVRRCFEHGLADVLADAPLPVLLARHAGAPFCAVPGAWATPPTPVTPTAASAPAPREASYDETPGRAVAASGAS